MSNDIVALQCPKCGSTLNVGRKEMRFGLEFSCSHCGATSVLIIENHLYVRREGDRVCATCGSVAGSNARFCQCGAALVSGCLLCRTEFAVAHRICDHCGWPNGLEPESSEGWKIQVQKAVKNAESREPNWHSFFAVISKARSKVGSDGPRVVEILLGVLSNFADEAYSHHNEVPRVISRLGDVAIRAIPELAEIAMTKWPHTLSWQCLRAIQNIGVRTTDVRLRKDFELVGSKLAEFLETKAPDRPSQFLREDWDISFVATCGAIAGLGLGERACAIAVRVCHKGIRSASLDGLLGFNSLEAIGKPAIPTLEQFTKGLFRDRQQDNMARCAIRGIESQAQRYNEFI